MAEIWNLNTLCRCCHAAGNFNSLSDGYVKSESYADILRKTFSLNMIPPVNDQISYTICDICTVGLLQAAQFKQRVLYCEIKLAEYYRSKFGADQDYENINATIKRETQSDQVKDDCETEKSYVMKQESEVESETSLIDECGMSDCDTKIEPQDEAIVECDSEVVEDELIKESPDTKINPEHSRKKKKKPKSDKKKPCNVKRQVKCIKQASNTKRGKTKKSAQNPGDNLEVTDKTLILKDQTENGTIHKPCDDSFKDLASKKRHIPKEEKNSYKCKECHIQYLDKSIYDDHLEKHKELKAGPFFCDICNRTFTHKRCIIPHLLKHMTGPKLKCHLCVTEFKYPSSLRRHIKMHNGIFNGGICDVCGREFKNKTHLLNHKRTVHDKIRPFTCDVCNKSFTYRKHLVAHKESHSSDRKRLQCDKCPKSYLCKTAFKSHQNLHSSGGSTNKGGPSNRSKTLCGICNIRFRTMQRRFEHICAVHPDKIKHVCHICGKKYSSKYILERHISTHNPVKQFSCEKCSKRFHTACTLKRHLNYVHGPTRDDPLRRCGLCKKRVKNMAKHMISHNNRDLCCPHCDKAYSATSALNRHISSFHLGIKPILCTLCVKKNYLKPRSIERHMLRKHNVIWKKETHEGSSENVQNDS